MEKSPAEWSKWSLVILPRPALLAGGSTRVEAAYSVWRSVWQPVLRDAGKCDVLPSDTFTRQSERVALFREGECAAVSLFNVVDLSRSHFRDDSFFSLWPPITVRALMRDGPSVLIGNGIAVPPAFRKRDFGFFTKDLLMAVVIRCLLESPCDAMAGNMRNSKGMNDLAYFWGATPLLRNVEVNGELSDLVGFFRSSVKPQADPELAMLVDRLWSDRQVEGESRSPLRRSA